MLPRELPRQLPGRWFCLYAMNQRIEEVVFGADGGYRSLTYADPDSPYPTERVDLELRGSYSIRDDVISMHITRIPTMELYGRAPEADEHVAARVLRIDADTLVWSNPRLARNEQACLRAGIEPYAQGRLLAQAR